MNKWKLEAFREIISLFIEVLFHHLVHIFVIEHLASFWQWHSVSNFLQECSDINNCKRCSTEVRNELIELGHKFISSYFVLRH